MGFFSPEIKSTSDNTQSQDQSSQGTSKAYLDPNVRFQRDHLLELLRQRIEAGNSFQDNFTTTGLQNINQGADIKRRMAENMVRSRGLGATSAGNSYLGGINNSAVSDKVNFLNTVPMWRDQYDRQNINDLAGFVNAQPNGQDVSSISHSSGSSSESSTQKKTGGLFQDLLGAGASIFGAAMGGGLFGKKPSGGAM